MPLILLVYSSVSTHYQDYAAAEKAISTAKKHSSPYHQNQYKDDQRLLITQLEKQMKTKINRILFTIVMALTAFVSSLCFFSINRKSRERERAIKAQSQQYLDEQKEMMQQLIRNQSVATFLIDSHHKVLAWNRACENLTGIRAENIVGTSGAGRAFYDNRDTCLADFVLAQKTTEISHFYEKNRPSALNKQAMYAENWFENLGGKKRYMIFDAAPIMDAEDNIVAVVETLQDITELKFAELALQDTNQKELENTQQLQTIFDTVLDSLVVIDETGVIQSANYATTELFGYAHETLIGSNINRLIKAKNLQEDFIHRYLQTTDEAKRRKSCEVLGHRKNGELFAMDIYIRKIKIEGHSRFVTTIQDVSKRRYREMLYRLMSENVEGYATLVLDVDGYISNWNEGARKLKGYTEQEVLGQHHRVFYTLEDQAKKLPESLLTTAAEKGYAQHEGWRVRKDGSLFYAEVVINSLQHDDGSLLGFVKVTRDGTVRKQMEVQLQQAYTNLEEFTAVASHDLKSPIRGIADLVDWVKEDLGENCQEEVKSNLDRIQLRINRMQRLIDDLLQYSLAGRVSAEVTRVEPMELIHEVLELQPIPTDFTVNVTGKASVFNAAITPLQTVLRNLISNAIKHHDHDTGSIDIHLKVAGSYSVFEITDDGPGISELAHDRIFKLFQTLSKSEVSTGVGLAVAKRMAEAHGGAIELVSNSDVRGTTFRVWWPRFQVK